MSVFKNLNEGQSACVVLGNIRKDDPNDNTVVSKIYKDNRFAITDAIKSKKLKKIDSKMDYIIYPTKGLKLKDDSNKKIILDQLYRQGRCVLIDENYSYLSNEARRSIVSTMPYGGVSLDKLFDTYDKNLLYSKIMRILDFLQENNLSHNDLHLENFVVLNDHIRIIDLDYFEFHKTENDLEKVKSLFQNI